MWFGLCAIAGIIGMPADEKTVQKMLNTMNRRGPDGKGVYREDEITLLHTRLAIIDPDGGKQPMQKSMFGETYTIVYNGELYNTQEVRSELARQGHVFSSHSDTEVVLHAYIQWKDKCVEKLNGIFAFAVWDQRRRRLFLARDRIGVKPLFYRCMDQCLLFASEIKTILAYPTVRAQLDAQGASQLLLLGPGRIPGSGVLKNIDELEPGCCGYFENGKFLIKRYWHLKDREHTDSFADTAQYVRHLVTDSVRRQMVSDVPIGTFLSGGLDSSIITAICAGEQKARGEQLKTFSVDYVDQEKYFIPGKFQPNSDSHYIQVMQDALQTDHHWTILSPEDLLDDLEHSLEARDLPGMADVDFSLCAFCREIRREVKVALSGECADEIFGGYPWYRDPEVRARAGFPWAQNTLQRSRLLREGICPDAESFVMDQYRKTCAESNILPGTSDQERRMKEMVNLNFRWFMQTLLDRKDRMSMYHSLEVRVPFCDYRIAEYMYAVPWEMKDYQGKEKGLLRHAMEGLLPVEVLWRKKSPYPKTFDPRYAHIVENRFRTLLADQNAPVFSLISRQEAENLFHAEDSWPWYGQLMRTPQIMAYFLQMDYWLRAYHVDLLV